MATKKEYLHIALENENDVICAIEKTKELNDQIKRLQEKKADLLSGIVALGMDKAGTYEFSDGTKASYICFYGRTFDSKKFIAEYGQEVYDKFMKQNEKPTEYVR